MRRTKRTGENGVKRLAQVDARRQPVGGGVFQAVRDPDIGHTWAAQGGPEGRADLATGDAMLDPELPYARISAGQGKATGRQGMAKAGRVEIQAMTVCLCPVKPACKMLGAQ